MFSSRWKHVDVRSVELSGDAECEGGGGGVGELGPTARCGKKVVANLKPAPNRNLTARRGNKVVTFELLALSLDDVCYGYTANVTDRKELRIQLAAVGYVLLKNLTTKVGGGWLVGWSAG